MAMGFYLCDEMERQKVCSFAFLVQKSQKFTESKMSYSKNKNSPNRTKNYIDIYLNSDIWYDMIWYDIYLILEKEEKN